jgi:hypothetical protein
MKKLLISAAVLALFALPGMANAEQCRNAKGQFAKCGTPGAMPAGAKMGGMKMAPAKPVATPALAMAPAMKAAPCKDAKGKFAKCPPAAAKPAAAPAMAPAKKGPCKDDKGKFKKC